MQLHDYFQVFLVKNEFVVEMFWIATLRILEYSVFKIQMQI